MARTKGAVNQIKMDAQLKAHELQIDPFEVLLLFCANKWDKLGYKSPTKTMYTAEGSSYEVDIISPELRVNAAKDAASYLLAKRKAVEHSLSDIPDQAFDQEIERRVHLKILNGEIKASDVS